MSQFGHNGGMAWPRRVEIVEVGPRDGLQNEAVVLDAATKLSFIARAVATGVRRIEVASFVNPSGYRRWPTPRRSSPASVAAPPDGVRPSAWCSTVAVWTGRWPPGSPRSTRWSSPPTPSG